MAIYKDVCIGNALSHKFILYLEQHESCWEGPFMFPVGSFWFDRFLAYGGLILPISSLIVFKSSPEGTLLMQYQGRTSMWSDAGCM